MVFPAYVCHTRQEQKFHIFQGKQKARGLMGLLAKQVIRSRILYLSFDILDSIGCHWDLPPNRVHRMDPPILPLPLMWRFTLARLSHSMIGIK